MGGKLMKQKMKRRLKESLKIIQITLGVSLFFFLAGTDSSQANDWEPLPWGLNLEELNLAYKAKFKAGQIREDKERSEIELQYSPARSVKARRGELVALVSSTDSSSAFRLFGYAYDGKFFGQAIFFKDHPEFFPETINSTLKKKYPQGKIIRSLGATRFISAFEFKSDSLYVFTAEKGVFFYEPHLLEIVAKKFQGQVEQEKEKIEKEWRDQPVMP
jgi:hypothetical protein